MIQKILTITVMSFSFLGLFGQTNNLFKTTDVAEFEKAIETHVLTGKVLRLIRDAATVTVGVDNEQK
mgnify:CR=1 FL=1